ncbi:MAG: hypothetical protein L6V90_08390 [Treponema succinifaciens]|nr:MAG: hypothetical protein L6V90_08390 [Treponema succinifaciens]
MRRFLLQRDNNEVSVNHLYDNESKIILRKNASIISTLHQYAIQEIEPVFNFFNKHTINVTYTGLRYEIRRDVPAISEVYFHTPEALNFSKQLIKKFDTGISDITISFREDEKKIRKNLFFRFFCHNVDNPNNKLGIDSESTGTRALYINLLYYYENLKIWWSSCF